MSISITALEALSDNGATAAMIVAAIKADAAIDGERNKKRRAKNAARMRAVRAVQNVQRTSMHKRAQARTDGLSAQDIVADSDDTPYRSVVEEPPESQPTISKEKSPHTPLKENNTSRGERARGTHLPDDWKPSQADIGYAQDLGLTAERIQFETERFRNWATSASGKNAIKRNWSRAWQNWVLQARGPPRQGVLPFEKSNVVEMPNGRRNGTPAPRKTMLDAFDEIAAEFAAKRGT